MNDNNYPGSQVMIKIDGARIRQLREQKGLTQLYIATAVDVTTDTVSRWENKRYPSIKKENGIRLAEALEVELEDILEYDDTEAGYSEPIEQQSDTPPESEDFTQDHLRKKSIPLNRTTATTTSEKRNGFHIPRPRVFVEEYQKLSREV